MCSADPRYRDQYKQHIVDFMKEHIKDDKGEADQMHPSTTPSFDGDLLTNESGVDLAEPESADVKGKEREPVHDDKETTIEEDNETGAAVGREEEAQGDQ